MRFLAYIFIFFSLALQAEFFDFAVIKTSAKIYFYSEFLGLEKNLEIFKCEYPKSTIAKYFMAYNTRLNSISKREFENRKFGKISKVRLEEIKLLIKLLEYSKTQSVSLNNISKPSNNCAKKYDDEIQSLRKLESIFELKFDTSMIATATGKKDLGQESIRSFLDSIQRQISHEDIFSY